MVGGVKVRIVEALSPAGLSSFFAICDRDEKGRPIEDPLRIGAIGGGFKLSPAIRTKVVIEEAERPEVIVKINGRRQDEALTSRNVVEDILKLAGSPDVRIEVEHEIPYPIGAGFGTSGAGALTLAVALSKALKVNLTMLELGRIAHVAEVRAKTGLGTVGALMTAGSCIITRCPGAPGYGVIDSIPLDTTGLLLIVVYFGPILTKDVLSDKMAYERINKAGKETLKRVLNEPTVENLLRYSYEFACKAGFLTENVRRVEKLIKDEGLEVLGYAQNMLGDAVHLLVERGKADELLIYLRRELKGCKILLCGLDDSSVKLRRM